MRNGLEIYMAHRIGADWIWYNAIKRGMELKKSSGARSSLENKKVEVVESVEMELYKRVRSYIAKARAKVYAVANKEKTEDRRRRGSETNLVAALIFDTLCPKLCI